MGERAGQKKVWYWFSLVIRLVLGGCFIYASWHKILAPDQFARILYGYDVFPGFSINILAIWVPYVELLSGILLITGGWKLLSGRSALLVINAMLVCFIVVISYNLIRGHSFDCGCFGFGHEPEGGARLAAVKLLIRDILLLAAGGLLWGGFVREGRSGHADQAKA